MQCNNHCHRDRSFLLRQRSYSMNSSCLKLKQLHPYTVCTFDSIHRPVICFARDLIWQAHQLVHAGDDSASAKSLERLDTKKLRSVKVECLIALPGKLLRMYMYMYDVYLLPPHDQSLNPNEDHSLYCAKLKKKEQCARLGKK